MKNRILLFLSYLLLAVPISAQISNQENKLVDELNSFFNKYKQSGTDFEFQPKMEKYVLDNTNRTLDIYADDHFGAQSFSPKVTSYIYKRLHNTIPQPYNAYKITVFACGMTIDELIPNRLSDNADKSRLWGDTEYKGNPWVQNISKPYVITHGLQNRHLSVWASHGRYFDVNRNVWRWQRPNLFGTSEDLFTQTIVVPYLIPMLENAGAVVFTPRERDWQRHEVIVDNDTCSAGSYMEIGRDRVWQTADSTGFKYHDSIYTDKENPFMAGTVRFANTTTHKGGTATASYMPDIPEAGRYAVYVSYRSMPNSVSDAHYTIFHKGEKTTFRVNQQMGGGTWVYLGTFDFDKGANRFNRVTLNNESNHRGVVSADAVRFGGGMGNISRNGMVSGLPRCLEGARYYAQWAGMDYSIYSSKNGADDYGDDINTRSYMTNYLGGGSIFMPSLQGQKVPFELSLAVHSDAGYRKNGKDIVGSLAICTTDFNDGLLNSGVSRMASRDFADALLAGVTRDIKYKYGVWSRRELFDRNYSETRNPEIPSAILETMSHQNFPDMKYGQDPNFKFTLARSIYKTMLRYVCDMHGEDYVVAPLTPNKFRVDINKQGVASLQWSTVSDPQESTATPTGFVVYTACGKGDFDNGTYVRARNTYSLTLQPSMMYRFKVTAVNRGGESFPSEILSALYNPSSTNTILIINGFHRLSSPAIRYSDTEQGFDLDADPGVSYGKTAGWNGRQTNFDVAGMGVTLGECGDELAGKFIAGYDFDNPVIHGEAIKSAGNFSFVSCSSDALENTDINLNKYSVIDLVLGLEKDDRHSLVQYKALPTYLQTHLTSYVHAGGKILVSGSFTGSDSQLPTEQKFLSSVLKCRYSQCDSLTADAQISGLGITFPIYSSINENHYAAIYPDVLSPETPAYCAMTYPDGHSACVAYSGKDYRAMTMAFPFECIQSAATRNAVMKGILKYLLQQ
jgi:hypothetical protein